MNFFVLMGICIVAQIVFFIPFYFIWRNDCKKIGKENLAVSLWERFQAWILLVPLWLIPILQAIKSK